MKYCSKIIFFYVIFFTALIGFFAAVLAISYQNLNYTNSNGSLIDSNPVLEFRPMPPESNVESSLIWYKSSDKGNVHYWKNELTKFLEPYTKAEKSEHAQNCRYNDKPAEGKFCVFHISDERYAPCTKDFGYGYDSSSGCCIFLMLNKVKHGWVPDYYNSTTAPDNLPNEIREEMLRTEIQNEGMPPQHQVWVDCAGQTPADVENIGIIRYFPGRGFPEKYFPFQNIEGYLSPLVALHFENPKHGVLINVECRAWARNIHHVDGGGVVQFQLLVD